MSAWSNYSGSIEAISVGVIGGAAVFLGAAKAYGLSLLQAGEALTPEVVFESAQSAAKIMGPVAWGASFVFVWGVMTLRRDVKKLIELPTKEEWVKSDKASQARHREVLAAISQLRKDLAPRVSKLENEMIAVQTRHETEDRLAAN